MAHLPAGQLGGGVAGASAIAASVATHALEKAGWMASVWPRMPFQLSRMMGRDEMMAFRSWYVDTALV